VPDRGQLRQHPGTGERAGSWREWCHLLQRSMDTPKIALVMSLAVAGLYVKPLALESYVVHLAGQSSRGKSTAAVMTAGIFGNPDTGRVIVGWDVSAKGLPAWLRALRILTGFRDELSMAGFSPAELQDVMFRVTGGAERHTSSRTGMYRAPATGWHGCLISTGNKSIVGQIDNEAVYSRVIEIETPFTHNHAQAEAFKEMAREHYGHGIYAIAERGLSPKEWALRLRKAKLDLTIPQGDVLGRAGIHLAGAVAGARLLEEICGIEDFHQPVLQAAQSVLESLANELTSYGRTPDVRLRLAIADMTARNPSVFPTEAEYERAILGEFRMPDIYGWDRTGSDKPGDYAILHSGMKAICRDYEITDLTVALRLLNQNGLLIRNQRAQNATNFDAQAWIAGKNRRVYIVRGVLDAVAESASEGASNRDEPDETPDLTGVLTGGLTGQFTHPDQGSNRSNRGLRDEVCREDLTSLSDDELAALVNATADDATLDAVLAELDRRSLPPDAAVDGRKGVPEGLFTDQGSHAAESRAEGANGGSGEVGSAAWQWANWRKWLAGALVRDWLERHQIDLDEEVARRALAGWHHAMEGLWWAEYPGRVGLNLYARLRAQHPNMPEVERCTDGRANSISTDGSLVRLLDYVDTSQVPQVGQKVTSTDVNNQFLAAAESVILGDGEPTVITRWRRLEDFFTAPGYLVINRDLKIDHPAFVDRSVTAGQALPMPLAKYLHQWGVDLPVGELIVWTSHGTRLKRHAQRLRTGLRYLSQWDHAPARIARLAVKTVYATMYGGMLRSDTNNPWMRRDWSDQLMSQAWANAFRGLDHAAYDIPAVQNGKRGHYPKVLQARDQNPTRTYPALGICKDTAYFLHDHNEPWTPPSLELVPAQPGKWKVEKHVDVTEDIIRAVEIGSAYGLRDSVNAAWKDTR
jgi:hypothetical protein